MTSSDKSTNRQEAADRFYWSRGVACCAGCDWWRHLNSVAGECLRSAAVGQNERFVMLGIEGCSLPSRAGHVLTPRDHVCGEFRDSFDWRSLPLPYLSRIGFNDA